MLAEIAAANAAFAVLKQTVMNGRDLMSAGKAISSLVNAEEELRNRGNKKKNSFWRKVGGNEGSDLEEFMALEELKQKRAELESMMRLYGRGGLYNDWVRFQVEARKRRQREIEELKQKREKAIEWTIIIGLILLGGAIAVYFFWMLYLAVNN